MDRRNALTVLALAVSAPSLAFGAAMEDAEKEHASQALAVGSVALGTRKIAQSKAEASRVNKFAQYEPPNKQQLRKY